MVVKSFFDILKPADKLAIETTFKNEKQEEIERCYKEQKARESSHYDSDIEMLLIFLAIVLLIVVVFCIITDIQLNYITRGVKEIGPDVCKAHNLTYQGYTEGHWHDEIICSDSVIIKIPQ